MLTDVIFIFNIIVFTKELEEPKSPSISDNTFLMVDDLIGGVRLEDIFSEAVLSIRVIVVIVINNFDLKIVRTCGFVVTLINVLEDKFAQFYDEIRNILKYSIVGVFINLFN